MADQTLREWFTAEVKPLLPTGWRFIPNQKTPENPTRVTVVLKHLTIDPLEEAPRSSLLNGLVLTVISPYQDDVAAENQLDDDVITFITALIRRPQLKWTSARKVRDDTSGRLAWDINVTALTGLPIEGA